MTKIMLLGQDPGNPEDLLVPMARVLHTVPVGTTLRDIADLPHRVGGRAAAPRRAIAFHGANGAVSMIYGGGHTEAAELQEMAYALYEKQQARLRQGITGIDREALGLPTRESFDARYRQHMADKLAHFRSHAVTNPGEDPRARRVF